MADDQGAPAAADEPREPVEVDLTDIGPWIVERRRIQAQIDGLITARDALDERIKNRMGDAETALVGGRPAIRWAYTKPAPYVDRKALEKDHPEIAAAYTKTKRPSRRYVVLKPDGAA